jgi:hypothetical protein
MFTAKTETAIFDNVIANCAPNIPRDRRCPPHAIVSPEETINILEHWTYIAGHDLHIARVLNRAGQFHGDFAWTTMIARQMGDDAAHAEFLRDYIHARCGTDPLRRIEAIADMHDELLDDIPSRNIYGFIAWELHYEFYILARLMTERRTARLNDPGIAEFATARIGPDEEEHRLRVVTWVMRWLASLDKERRHEVAANVLRYDDEIQHRLWSYLHLRYQQSALSTQTDVANAGAVYDGFRRGVQTAVLGIASTVSVGALS